MNDSNGFDTFPVVFSDKSVMMVNNNDVTKDVTPETMRIALETIHSSCFPSAVAITQLILLH